MRRGRLRRRAAIDRIEQSTRHDLAGAMELAKKLAEEERLGQQELYLLTTARAAPGSGNTDAIRRLGRNWPSTTASPTTT